MVIHSHSSIHILLLYCDSGLVDNKHYVMLKDNILIRYQILDILSKMKIRKMHM